MYALRERRQHVTQEDFEFAIAKVSGRIASTRERGWRLQRGCPGVFSEQDLLTTAPPRRFSNGTKTQIRLSANYSAELSCGGYVLMYPMQSGDILSCNFGRLLYPYDCGLIDPVYLVLFMICRSLRSAYRWAPSSYIALHSLDLDLTWPASRRLSFWPVVTPKIPKIPIFCVCWTLLSTAAHCSSLPPTGIGKVSRIPRYSKPLRTSTFE
jgi:hypothetical protein